MWLRSDSARRKNSLQSIYGLGDSSAWASSLKLAARPLAGFFVAGRRLPAPSHHLALPEVRDFFGAEAKFGKDFLGLLAELRRPRYHAARGARQRHRLADQTDVAVLGVRYVLRDAKMLDLGVLEHLVYRIDGPAGDTGGVEFAHPHLGGFGLGALADLGIEGVAVLRTRRRGRIVGVGHEFRGTDRLRAAFPYSATRRCNVDIAVGSLEHPGRTGGRLVVAGRPGDSFFH